MEVSVQITDKWLLTENYERKLSLAAAIGVKFVRVDLNWPWIEQAPGEYLWDTYDKLLSSLRLLGLRPILILNRPNSALDGHLYSPDGDYLVTQFATWAAAVAKRYSRYRPILEIWNEPDKDQFWPPKSNANSYIKLATKTCAAIRENRVWAFIIAPASANMPTVWKETNDLWDALEQNQPLIDCLDGISLHTHRFNQLPETVLLDYRIIAKRYPKIWSKAKRSLFVSEYGESNYSEGVSEEVQANWLVRMFIINSANGVALTNWYCLMDTGNDKKDRESNFGLIRQDESIRASYVAMTRYTRLTAGKEVVDSYIAISSDRQSADGTVVFCSAKHSMRNCIAASWGSAKPRAFTMSGMAHKWKVLHRIGHFSRSKDDSEGVWNEVRPIIWPNSLRTKMQVIYNGKGH